MYKILPPAVAFPSAPQGCSRHTRPSSSWGLILKRKIKDSAQNCAPRPLAAVFLGAKVFHGEGALFVTFSYFIQQAYADLRRVTKGKWSIFSQGPSQLLYQVSLRGSGFHDRCVFIHEK